MKIVERYFMPGICMAMWVAAMAFESAQASGLVAQKYPDVVKVAVRAHGADRFDFDVTLSSPYDTAERYADAFKAMSKEGSVYGERILWHDHADEQPFTRDLYNVTIPRGVREVVIQSRDKLYGYGGKTVEVKLPGR